MAKQSATLADMRDGLKQEFIAELEKTPAEANSLAYCAVGYFRRIYGGDSLYVPKDDALDERDWKMWELFNGSNYQEVGQAFSLTARQARNRIKLVRRLATAKEQPDLFAAAAAE